MKRFLLVALVLALAGAGAALAQAPERYDLRIRLELSEALTRALQPGDILSVALYPEVQYGVATSTGTPILAENVWNGAVDAGAFVLERSVERDRIYRMEVFVTRRLADGREVRARYVSSRARLPERGLDEPLALPLVRDDRPADARSWDTMLLVRDDGQRMTVMLFGA